MFVVKKITLGAGDEELATVSIFSAVCHAQQSGCVVLEVEILIRECAAVEDVDYSSAIIVYEVASLNHEVLNHSVEACAFVTRKRTYLVRFFKGTLKWDSLFTRDRTLFKRHGESTDSRNIHLFISSPSPVWRQTKD